MLGVSLGSGLWPGQPETLNIVGMSTLGSPRVGVVDKLIELVTTFRIMGLTLDFARALITVAHALSLGTVVLHHFHALLMLLGKMYVLQEPCGPPPLQIHLL